jgi:hypothetical protein
MTTLTSRLFPNRRAQLIDWLRRHDPWHALSLLIVVAVLMGVWSARPDAPSSVQQPTPAPVILVATPLPATFIPIAASSVELLLLRAVVAYDAPDGTVLGATLPGRPYQLVARSGAAWVLLAVEDSGSVWVRRDELEGVVDLAAPLPSAQTIVITNEQQRTAPDALPATTAPPTPTGAPPASAPTVPQTIVYLNADGSVLATYKCEPYGDWRDNDPIYVHPECGE